MTDKVINSYDFSEDAMGLGDFVSSEMAKLPDDEVVVYVEDEKGRSAVSASFIRKILTDGSTVVNLVISFKA